MLICDWVSDLCSSVRRIVGMHRRRPRHQRIVARAQRVTPGARDRAGDPLALAGVGGGAAVERGREFECDGRATQGGTLDDRKLVVYGKRVSVSVTLGGGCILIKKNYDT